MKDATEEIVELLEMIDTFAIRFAVVETPPAAISSSAGRGQ
jgi:hypothetical protein